jgi:hypothetical protein
MGRVDVVLRLERLLGRAIDVHLFFLFGLLQPLYLTA